MRTIRYLTGDGVLHDASLDDGAALSEVLPADGVLARPIDPPEVWCSGVTYERSRDARMEESAVQDVYDLVYEAHRPELFLKDAASRRTVGPGEPIGIRGDSTWNVPEPEIGVVVGERGKILAYTIGNDVSSREIEGANPLLNAFVHLDPSSRIAANAGSSGSRSAPCQKPWSPPAM